MAVKKAIKVAGLLTLLGGLSVAWYYVAKRIRDEIEEETGVELE